MPTLPGWLAQLIVLTQIGFFCLTGILAVLLAEPGRRFPAYVLAGSSVAYGTTLYLNVYTPADLFGYPSLFLLVFIVTLVVSGLHDRSSQIRKDQE